MSGREEIACYFLFKSSSSLPYSANPVSNEVEGEMVQKLSCLIIDNLWANVENNKTHKNHTELKKLLQMYKSAYDKRVYCLELYGNEIHQCFCCTLGIYFSFAH